MKLTAREKAFALKHFTSQRRMASVDVFGRQLTRSVGGSRGPPGEGFKITLDGQYDMDNRRLCNLADPTSNNDAVSMRVLQSTVQQEVRLTYAVTSSLRNDVDDTSVMIQTLESQFQESLKNQRINNETVQTSQRTILKSLLSWTRDCEDWREAGRTMTIVRRFAVSNQV